MPAPAARLTDMHACPMVTPGVPPVPHVGGPIVSPGAPTVLISALPAARVSDMCVCVGPPDSIVMGSLGVLIAGLPAARIGDPTTHGGVIVAGAPTVIIGDIGFAAGSLGALAMAAISAGVGAATAALAAAAAAMGQKNPAVNLLTTGGQLTPAQDQANALRGAALGGFPFCQRCAEAAAKALAAAMGH